MLLKPGNECIMQIRIRTAAVEVFRQILMSIALRERTINRVFNFCIARQTLWIGVFCLETDVGKVSESLCIMIFILSSRFYTSRYGHNMVY